MLALTRFPVYFTLLLLPTLIWAGVIGVDHDTLHDNTELPKKTDSEQQRFATKIGATACPSVCTCEDGTLSHGAFGPTTGKSSYQIIPSFPLLPSVSCTRQSLTSVPDGIPGDTRKL